MPPFALNFMVLGILASNPQTDGGSLTWNEPPPTQIVKAVPYTVDHNSTRQLHEGTKNATLSWQFDLTEIKFASLAIWFNGTSIAGVQSSGSGPEPGFENQFGIDWIPNQTFVRLIIFNVTTEEKGTFTCRVLALRKMAGFASFEFKSKVQVDVVAPPSNIVISSDLNIIAPAELNLNCSADGKPKPTITWTRVSDNTVVTMPLNITGKKDGGGYRCTADNGVGKRLTKDVFVDVQISPMVALASKVFVDREQTVSLICEVEGNPRPAISWSPCSGQSVVCDEHYLNISSVQTARANYTCTATNTLGEDSATTLLLIGGKNVYLRLNMTGECDNEDSVWENLQNKFVTVFASTQSYSGAQLMVVRCESLSFDVVLKFTNKVAEDDTIFIIQRAILDGKLGELGVNISHVIGIPPVEGTATDRSASEPTSTEPEGTATDQSTSEPTSTEPEGSPGRPQIIIIIAAVIGVVVLLGIIVGGVIWWWKYRKTNKIRHSEEDRNVPRRQTQVPRACAQSGPLAANGTDGAAEHAPPVHDDNENPDEILGEPKEDKKKEADPNERTDYATTQFLRKSATLRPSNGNGDTGTELKRRSKKEESPI